MRRIIICIAVMIMVMAIGVLYACRKQIAHDVIEASNTSAAGEIDTNEFAPGHPDVKIPAIAQLRSFPAPRFKSGHTLLPNVQWMSPHYFGGLGQPGKKTNEIVSGSVEIQYELASHWHYYLLLPGNTKGHPDTFDDPKTIAGAWIKLANEHPELPASVITHWAALHPNIAGFKSKAPYILHKKLPAQHYVAGTENAKGRKKINPSAPIDSFKLDGRTQRFYIERLLKELTRPVQLINENGEVFSPYSTSLLENDPHAKKDKEALGIKDWETYKAHGRTRITNAYRDEFMSLPGLKNTIFTEYAIDGHKTYRDRYSEVRKINTPIKGQYYATPDFYPRWPSNWETWKGAWHGIKWITDSRQTEIALGDELFSPFVAAGWDDNEENNIRPAQWLGLLKALGVMGAEFHYTGFFNLKEPFAKPENYAWQAVMPIYSQAITSRYENILRNGELLNSPNYRFNTGNKNELIFVRKHKTLALYVITGSIQPSSNKKGETALEAETSISLNGKTLRFKIRRQGSTYIYDLSDAANPVFYQLDGWHESLHPSRWKQEFLLEGELADRAAEGSYIGTESKSEGDYREFTSYAGITGNDTLSYGFEPREGWPKEYHIWIRARVKGSKASKITVIAGNDRAQAETLKEKSWKWYHIVSPKKEAFSFAPAAHLLKITADSELEIDKMIITPQSKEPENGR